MSDLHLIEGPLDLRRLHVWAEGRGYSGRGELDEGLALHHLIGELFGPEILQPFRLMVSPGAKRGTFLGYAGKDHRDLGDIARVAGLPEALGILDMARLRSVPRPSNAWREGQRLGFDLRTRPVVRLARAMKVGGKTAGKGAEIDVFQHRAERGDGESREAVYLDWLEVHLRRAAKLDRDATRLAKFQRLRLRRAGRQVEGPDAVFHGTLTVTDPQEFAQLLTRGVGRHRAYGFGMLLLRPQQKR